MGPLRHDPFLSNKIVSFQREKKNEIISFHVKESKMSKDDAIYYLKTNGITTSIIGIYFALSLNEAESKHYPHKSSIFELEPTTFAFTFSDESLQSEVSQNLCILAFSERNCNNINITSDEYSYGLHKYNDNLYYITFETVIQTGLCQRICSCFCSHIFICCVFGMKK